MKPPRLFTHCIRPAIALALCVSLLGSGCVSRNYKPAPKNTPPPQVLNLALAQEPFEVGLNTLIAYNGPGSWIRDALWDEYVFTLRNPTSTSLTLSSFTLVDVLGTDLSPGSDPAKLEQESILLEMKYKEIDLTFVRFTAVVILVGSQAASMAIVGALSLSGTLVAVAATAVIIPVLIGVRIYQGNKQAAMKREFHKRRISLPLTLAPEETITGSLFFPMAAGPRSLRVGWSSETASGELVLPLDFLKGLHLKTPAPSDEPTVKPATDKNE